MNTATHRLPSTYTEPADIVERLAVLYTKAERVVLYNASVRAGTPNPSLLDEKQQTTLAQPGRAGQPYPFLRSIGGAIDCLKVKHLQVERAERERLHRVSVAVEKNADRILDGLGVAG